MTNHYPRAWCIALLVGLGACNPPAQPKSGSKAADGKPAEPVQAPGWDNLRLNVVGVGRLTQGDVPKQAVLDGHKATAEGALEPMAKCLRESEEAKDAKPVKLELRFGKDDTGRTRVSPLIFGHITDETVGTCLRIALGDAVEPEPDEQIAVEAAVLVEIKVR